MSKLICKMFLFAAVNAGVLVIGCGNNSPTSTGTLSPVIGNWSGIAPVVDSTVFYSIPFKATVSETERWNISSTRYIRSQTINGTGVYYLPTGNPTNPVHDSTINITGIETDTGTWVISGTFIICTSPRQWVSMNGSTPIIASAPAIDTTSISGISGSTWVSTVLWQEPDGTTKTYAITLTKS